MVLKRKRSLIPIPSAAYMFDYTYRLWLIRELAQLIAVPDAIIFACFRALDELGHGQQVGALVRGVAYVVAPFAFGAARMHLSRWNNERKARIKGIKLPKVITGQKWGNVDLMKR